MGEFAVEAQRQGRSTRLLTARWEPSWPSTLTYRDVPVIRLRQLKARFIGTLVYMVALRRWLRRYQSSYDLVFVSLLKHDAVAAHWAVKSRRPLVLIAEGSGSTGDCAWQEQAVLGRWIRRICYRADAVIAPSREIQEELLQAGYPPKKIHYLPHGVKIPPERTPERRHQARRSLAALHPRFHLQPDEELAVFVGRLHPGKGLREMVEAWRLVVQRRPTVRLWLVGEGPMETELHRQIDTAGLHSRVVLAGSFDDVGEILQAADLFVFPSHREGMSLALLEAMAAGLPIVATDIPGNRALVQSGESALLVPVESPRDLAEAVIHIAENRELAQRLAQRARSVAVTQFSLEETVRRHLELFDDIYTQFMKNRQVR
jgi:glycosyltransferase involved in cell wall biosynthesis